MAAPFYDQNAVLIDFKGAVWTLADALAGCLTLGGTGSGKSSAVASLLMTTVLTSTKTLAGGMGVLTIFAKSGEARQWFEACKRAGRSKDVIYFGPDGTQGFNLLAWISAWGAGAERGPLAIVDFLIELNSALDPVSGGAGGGDNAFFDNCHRTLLLNIVLLIQLSRLPVTLALMRAVALSIPRSLAEASDPNWSAHTVCGAALREAEAATQADPAGAADLAECRRFITQTYPSLSDRTRGVVDSMFTNLVQPFLTRPLRPLFCEKTTVTPRDIIEGGKVVLVDIAPQEFGLTGKLAGLCWKRAFQLEILRRSGPPGSLRPACLFIDEVQTYLSPGDSSYQAVARSAGGVTCFLTQQFSSIRDAMGSDDKAENLCSNLTTKIFCGNTGDTNEWASRLIGERYVNVTSMNIGRGGSVQEAGQGGPTSHAGISRHDEKRAWIEPSAFQRLRRGGEANGFLVDAVVFIGGKQFPGPDGLQPFKLLSFKQQR